MAFACFFQFSAVAPAIARLGKRIPGPEEEKEPQVALANEVLGAPVFRCRNVVSQLLWGHLWGSNFKSPYLAKRTFFPSKKTKPLRNGLDGLFL